VVLALGLAVTMAISTACTGRVGIPHARSVLLLTPDGARSAAVYHPPTAGANPPLVVVLHGAGGTGRWARSAHGWDALADREGLVVAYPDGWARTWNAGDCCGRARSRGVDDVAYLRQLVARLAEEDGIDPSRVYAVGMSNGGMMSYAWACSRPGDLAGVGVVVGARVTPCDDPGPVPLVVVHGAADTSVPIDGGVGPESMTRHDYPSLRHSLQPFLNAGRCGDSPDVTVAPPVTVTRWQCDPGRAVVAAVLDGFGHVWPGGSGGQGSRSPLDATEFIWTELTGSRS
jgi:polyhydroxybutyrate depolymerase